MSTIKSESKEKNFTVKLLSEVQQVGQTCKPYGKSRSELKAIMRDFKFFL